MAHCNTLQHTATHCNTLQHLYSHDLFLMYWYGTLQHTATHCNTLQHTATHCNTSILMTSFLCIYMAHCNTLQHTAIHCNTLQHLYSHDLFLMYWYGTFSCKLTFVLSVCTHAYMKKHVVHNTACVVLFFFFEISKQVSNNQQTDFTNMHAYIYVHICIDILTLLPFFPSFTYKKMNLTNLRSDSCAICWNFSKFSSVVILHSALCSKFTSENFQLRLDLGDFTRNQFALAATLCNTMQHTAMHCATQCNNLQHSVTLCNTLQHTATHLNTLQQSASFCTSLQHSTTHCNTLQLTATHCDTLQHTATHCNIPQHTATHLRLDLEELALNEFALAATHCNTLQHNATQCNTLQHTATNCSTPAPWPWRALAQWVRARCGCAEARPSL